MQESSPSQLKPTNYVYETLVYLQGNNVNRTSQKKYISQSKCMQKYISV